MKKVLLALVTVIFFATSFYKLESDKKAEPKTQKIKTPLTIIRKADPAKNITAEIYSSISFENINILNPEVFNKAYLGFTNLKKAGKLPANANIISIADFSLSSTEKRLWVIDLEKKKVLFNSLVAHGKNTGEEYAKNFSNTESSYQSSLGFYVTETTYNGSNG
ncbi:MAG: murein L,D-transpeptidase catalytic domain-containing protein, partial [Kaistella sp.]